ncbi:MAG TPA: alpha-1,2-fucosyltransferase [Paludibacter sp.]
MIVVSLFGGLGNQMFQYACGKAVAEELGVELKLDITHLLDRTQRDRFTFRDFELGVFNIEDQIATTKEVRNFIPNLWNSSELIKQSYRLIRLLKGNKYYFEKRKFQYEVRIKSVQDNTYLYGYFQTEKYFKNQKDEILKTFRIKTELDSINKSFITKMKDENSVSIHIRRGDYLHSPFNLLEIDSYYLKAINYISEHVENPVFYLFTNDYEWTSTNFAQFNIDKTIINHNQGDNSFMDMILMSNCKHNICANSSFSWWGAWLNQNPDKIIITPKEWFKTVNGEDTNNDLIPETWLRL